jgi:hypothetical protein
MTPVYNDMISKTLMQLLVKQHVNERKAATLAEALQTEMNRAHATTILMICKSIETSQRLQDQIRDAPDDDASIRRLAEDITINHARASVEAFVKTKIAAGGSA